MTQPSEQPEIFEEALIAFGSNALGVWGDPTSTIQKARKKIEETLGFKGTSSRIFRTPAFPKGAGPDFSNAVIRIGTNLPATDVLAVLHDIEAQAGRERLIRWGQRTLDLDLLALGNQVSPDLVQYRKWQRLAPDQQTQMAPEQLILPHPRLQDRSFVLVPMADVAPDWVHPVLGLTTIEMRDARPDAEIASVRPQ